MLEVPDDSGFLALLVPTAYQSFVAENWDFELLRSHFLKQMALGTMLIWGTGLEGFWRVDVRVGTVDVQGFREVSGPLLVVGGSVLLTSYDSLTMAAQYSDVSLPQSHERDQLFELPDGYYTCRVVQMFDPDTSDDSGSDDSADFVISLSPQSEPISPWSQIPWFTDT